MLILLIENNVKAETRDEFVAFITHHAEECLKEPGCVSFDILQDNSDPNKFFYIEAYRDEEARQSHMQTPHLKHYFERIGEFRDQRSNSHVVHNVFPSDASWRRETGAKSL